MRFLYSFLFLICGITYGQCVNSTTITSANYTQNLTQSNTFIIISSSVSSLRTVKLDANPTNGYVLMNPGFVANPTGNTAFTAQPLDGCGSLAPARIAYLDFKEDIVQEISIYPNPTTDILNLYSTIKILNYKIYTLEGKEIIPNKKINNNKEEINVSNLATGFYILYVETESNEVLSFKFVKN